MPRRGKAATGPSSRAAVGGAPPLPVARDDAEVPVGAVAEDLVAPGIDEVDAAMGAEREGLGCLRAHDRAQSSRRRRGAARARRRVEGREVSGHEERGEGEKAEQQEGSSPAQLAPALAGPCLLEQGVGLEIGVGPRARPVEEGHGEGVGKSAAGAVTGRSRGCGATAS